MKRGRMKIFYRLNDVLGFRRKILLICSIDKSVHGRKKNQANVEGLKNLNKN